MSPCERYCVIVQLSMLWELDSALPDWLLKTARFRALNAREATDALLHDRSLIKLQEEVSIHSY